MPKVTDRLISDPQVADKLRLADSYMLQRDRMGRSFSLPTEHALLRPIIDEYTHNFPEFVAYVRELRNTVQPRSSNYIALHELYRMLEVRLVQQQRRDRARKALAWLEKHYPKLNFDQKQRWIRKLEQQWGRERLDTLDTARRKTARGRVTTDERESLLEDFWAEVDERIEKGDLPTP